MVKYYKLARFNVIPMYLIPIHFDESMRIMQLGSELLASRKKTTNIRRGAVRFWHLRGKILAVGCFPLFSHPTKNLVTVYKLYIKPSALGVKPKWWCWFCFVGAIWNSFF